MRGKGSIHLLLLTVVVAGSASACLGEDGTAGDGLATKPSALLGVDQFLYFRSNATGWGVDETTRLSSFGGDAFARTYNVTQDWMISDADTAIVTETNQLDGWGTSQTFFGAASKRIVAPSATPPFIQIDSEASACAGVCPAGLTCSLISNGIPTCSEPPPTGP